MKRSSNQRDNARFVVPRWQLYPLFAAFAVAGIIRVNVAVAFAPHLRCGINAAGPSNGEDKRLRYIGVKPLCLSSNNTPGGEQLPFRNSQYQSKVHTHNYSSWNFKSRTRRKATVNAKTGSIQQSLSGFRMQRMSSHNPSSTALRAMPSGIEDVIFATQNAASSLANSVIDSNTSNASQLQSLLLLYTAGLWTSFSPCSLGLLPITVSYITTAANERRDKSTMLPTFAFAMGLAMVFTALGVSASALGGVFGGSNGGGGGQGTLSSLLLAAISSLVSVFMGLQLLELIEIPLPSLDFRWRSAVLQSGKRDGGRGSGGGNGSLFDVDGGLILENLNGSEGLNQVEEANGADQKTQQNNQVNDDGAVLLRTFLLGGISALVASPCATPVLASLLAYLASASSSIASTGSPGNELWKGAAWMVSYTLGYSTPLLFVGATGGQALVNLKNTERNDDGLDLRSSLGQWVTPLTGGVLIVFGMNGFLVALLGDPSLAGLAPIIE
ncbi:hypothetical protein HJC23_010774 [Cyclotella cryptica]|uniref:Cytochrome C biogenesis protein transmembrane domain-containing protein n=1 Tax=Cyclotella cryptica TaxID=29204 RepID=A0ABD3PW83_9STRA|eukprot:CCRYP_011126-RA/>CCRYP_011126-RA protein AED:0.01 eAED:0.01 QI:1493/1/1/1/0/0/2/208/497